MLKPRDPILMQVSHDACCESWCLPDVICPEVRERLGEEDGKADLPAWAPGERPTFFPNTPVQQADL
ncbi:hypothetical protein Misp01_37030 [Microtetraspora sp. NBRC 13810]|nr:hypothetical protein Misp01_37030 [Microtetraspora sp. NBRC 13810]